MNKMVSLKAALLREKDFKSLEEVRARECSRMLLRVVVVRLALYCTHACVNGLTLADRHPAVDRSL